MLAAAIAIPIFALGGGSGGSEALAAVDANAVGAIDPSTGRILSSIPVGGRPDHVAVGEGAIWTANSAADTVSRIDPEKHVVVQTIRVDSDPSGIAVGGGSVWVANALDGTLSRISPATNEVVKTIPVGNGPRGVAFGAGAVWVALLDDRQVARIDPASGRVLARIPAEGSPSGIMLGDGAVWTSNTSEGTVSRINARTNTFVQTFHVGNGPDAIAFGDGAVWVANSLDGTVSRIDPGTSRVVTLSVGEGPSGIATAPGVVVVASEFTETVSRIDSRTNEITRRTKIGNRPKGVALVSAGEAWVGVDPGGAAHSGGTLRIVGFDPVTGTIDPAVSWSDQVLSLTGDGLTAFRRVGGAAGATLVPDLATALPAPTDGGRTYTFQLRRGIRYSTGAVVRPEDVRRAIERVFERRSPGMGFYTAIIGSSGCSKRWGQCDLSKGIVADDAASTVTFHLAAPDAELLFKLALGFAYVVPARTPGNIPATRPFPATGPYVIRRYVPTRELELVRNPHFRVWSPAARTAGYVDRILVRIVDGSPAAPVRAVERGRADYAFTLMTPALVDELATQYPELQHTYPMALTQGLQLNTSLSPFNRRAVRQALSYAVDRRIVSRLSGGVLAGGTLSRLTCQVLPPHFPSYKPYCPYTLDHSPSGAPDLARARALVNRSGTRGTRVVLWTWWEPPTIARYLANVLTRLGYPTSVNKVGIDAFAKATKPGGGMQAALWGWIADYPYPGNFFGPLFTCAGTANLVTRFCDHRIDALVTQAERLQTTDPDQASAIWARLDREVTDRAPWVFLRTGAHMDVVSRRVGNYQYNPCCGVLFDQLWVR